MKGELKARDLQNTCIVSTCSASTAITNTGEEIGIKLGEKPQVQRNLRSQRRESQDREEVKLESEGSLSHNVPEDRRTMVDLMNTDGCR